jgi:hypothetical protein
MPSSRLIDRHRRHSRPSLFDRTRYAIPSGGNPDEEKQEGVFSTQAQWTHSIFPSSLAGYPVAINPNLMDRGRSAPKRAHHMNLSRIAETTYPISRYSRQAVWPIASDDSATREGFGRRVELLCTCRYDGSYGKTGEANHKKDSCSAEGKTLAASGAQAFRATANKR